MTTQTIKNLLFFERENSVCDYNHQPGIFTLSLKDKFIDWITKLSQCFSYCSATKFMALSLVDLASYHFDINKDLFSLCGVSCVMIASKMHESYVTEIDDYINFIGNKFNEREIREFEKDLAKVLNFNFNIPNIIDYNKIDAYESIKFNMLTIAIESVAMYLKRKYIPSVICSAAKKIVSVLDPEYKFINSFDVPISVVNQVSNEIYNVIFSNQSRQGLTEIINSILDITKLTKDKLKDNLKDFANCDYITAFEYLTSYFKRENKIIPQVNKKDYTSFTKLGKGAFGDVRIVKYKDIDYAKKKNNYNSYNEGLKQDFITEISTLRILSHKNVIKMTHIQNDGKSFFMELMDKDLYSFRKENTQLISNHEFQLWCTKELLEGLTYIHSIGCIVRDIKPMNILTRGTWPNLEIKYCDFGIAKIKRYDVPVHYTSEIITLYYRPPELLMECAKYTNNIDVWSLCCALYETFNDQILFKGEGEYDQFHKILSILGTPSLSEYPELKYYPRYSLILSKNYKRDSKFLEIENIHPKIKKVLDSGLTLNPKFRPSASYLLDIFSF